MAKPIKVTPVLKGRDALKFYAHLDSNKNKKVDKETIAEIQKTAELFNSLLKK